MAKDDPSQRPKSVVSGPSTNVAIAFPFSSIRTEQPTEEVRELAAIVAALSAHVAKLRPSPDTEELLKRAETVVTRLG